MKMRTVRQTGKMSVLQRLLHLTKNALASLAPSVKMSGMTAQNPGTPRASDRVDGETKLLPIQTESTAPLPTVEELTRHAAELARAAGCEELARRVVVRWSKRLTSTAGQARPTQGLVLLNPRLGAFPDEVERTLRHELAHLVASARSGSKRIAPHGPQWRQACADLGIPGESRCHALPLPRRKPERKYTYSCVRCGFELRRVRPINRRRRRLACLECCRQHAGGRFDARFEFTAVRPPEGKVA